jgi:hypothetical protein
MRCKDPSCPNEVWDWVGYGGRNPMVMPWNTTYVIQPQNLRETIYFTKRWDVQKMPFETKVFQLIKKPH